MQSVIQIMTVALQDIIKSDDASEWAKARARKALVDAYNEDRIQELEVELATLKGQRSLSIIPNIKEPSHVVEADQSGS